mmetsp:Transcript_130966/g.292965  ORF Transcript_130966/g.292965 Transcript_130966/m.292965 type:complete len:484 (-) Transcript_130966:182-1633(-)
MSRRVASPSPYWDRHEAPPRRARGGGSFHRHGESDFAPSWGGGGRGYDRSESPRPSPQRFRSRSRSQSWDRGIQRHRQREFDSGDDYEDDFQEERRSRQPPPPPPAPERRGHRHSRGAERGEACVTDTKPWRRHGGSSSQKVADHGEVREKVKEQRGKEKKKDKSERVKERKREERRMQKIAAAQQGPMHMAMMQGMMGMGMNPMHMAMMQQMGMVPPQYMHQMQQQQLPPPPPLPPPGFAAKKGKRRKGAGGEVGDGPGDDGAAAAASNSSSSDSSDSSDESGQEGDPGVQSAAAMAAMAAMWPQAAAAAVTGEAGSVEAFLAASHVGQEAIDRMRALPPHIQQLVMQRGPVANTRNPTAVLIARIRDAAKHGGGGPATWGAGAGAGWGAGASGGFGGATGDFDRGRAQPRDMNDDRGGGQPARKSAKAAIEAMISDYRLSPGCAWMMRSLPPDKQKLVASIDPAGEEDPSSYVAEQLKNIV